MHSLTLLPLNKEPSQEECESPLKQRSLRRMRSSISEQSELSRLIEALNKIEKSDKDMYLLSSAVKKSQFYQEYFPFLDQQRIMDQFCRRLKYSSSLAFEEIHEISEKPKTMTLMLQGVVWITAPKPSSDQGSMKVRIEMIQDKMDEAQLRGNIDPLSILSAEELFDYKYPKNTIVQIIIAPGHFGDLEFRHKSVRKTAVFSKTILHMANLDLQDFYELFMSYDRKKVFNYYPIYRIIKLFKLIPLFSQLNDATIESILRYSDKIQLTRGQSLNLDKEDSQIIYVIVEGEIELMEQINYLGIVVEDNLNSSAKLLRGLDLEEQEAMLIPSYRKKLKESSSRKDIWKNVAILGSGETIGESSLNKQKKNQKGVCKSVEASVYQIKTKILLFLLQGTPIDSKTVNFKSSWRDELKDTIQKVGLAYPQEGTSPRKMYKDLEIPHIQSERWKESESVQEDGIEDLFYAFAPESNKNNTFNIPSVINSSSVQKQKQAPSPQKILADCISKSPTLTQEKQGYSPKKFFGFASHNILGISPNNSKSYNEFNNKSSTSPNNKLNEKSPLKEKVKIPSLNFSEKYKEWCHDGNYEGFKLEDEEQEDARGSGDLQRLKLAANSLGVGEKNKNAQIQSSAPPTELSSKQTRDRQYEKQDKPNVKGTKNICPSKIIDISEARSLLSNLESKEIEESKQFSLKLEKVNSLLQDNQTQEHRSSHSRQEEEEKMISNRIQQNNNNNNNIEVQGQIDEHQQSSIIMNQDKRAEEDYQMGAYEKYQLNDSIQIPFQQELIPKQEVTNSVNLNKSKEIFNPSEKVQKLTSDLLGQRYFIVSKLIESPRKVASELSQISASQKLKQMQIESSKIKLDISASINQRSIDKQIDSIMSKTNLNFPTNKFNNNFTDLSQGQLSSKGTNGMYNSYKKIENLANIKGFGQVRPFESQEISSRKSDRLKHTKEYFDMTECHDKFSDDNFSSAQLLASQNPLLAKLPSYFVSESNSSRNQDKLFKRNNKKSFLLVEAKKVPIHSSSGSCDMKKSYNQQSNSSIIKSQPQAITLTSSRKSNNLKQLQKEIIPMKSSLYQNSSQPEINISSSQEINSITIGGNTPSALLSYRPSFTIETQGAVNNSQEDSKQKQQQAGIFDSPYLCNKKKQVICSPIEEAPSSSRKELQIQRQLESSHNKMSSKEKIDVLNQSQSNNYKQINKSGFKRLNLDNFNETNGQMAKNLSRLNSERVIREQNSSINLTNFKSNSKEPKDKSQNGLIDQILKQKGNNAALPYKLFGYVKPNNEASEFKQEYGLQKPESQQQSKGKNSSMQQLYSVIKFNDVCQKINLNQSMKGKMQNSYSKNKLDTDSTINTTEIEQNNSKERNLKINQREQKPQLQFLQHSNKQQQQQQNIDLNQSKKSILNTTNKRNRNKLSNGSNDIKAPTTTATIEKQEVTNNLENQSSNEATKEKKLSNVEQLYNFIIQNNNINNNNKEVIENNSPSNLEVKNLTQLPKQEIINEQQKGESIQNHQQGEQGNNQQQQKELKILKLEELLLGSEFAKQTQNTFKNMNDNLRKMHQKQTKENNLGKISQRIPSLWKEISNDHSKTKSNFHMNQHNYNLSSTKINLSPSKQNKSLEGRQDIKEHQKKIVKQLAEKKTEISQIELIGKHLAQNKIE